MRSIFHLLDEAEVFSEQDGGAISRWTANVLRDGEEIVVCPSADESWAFPGERVYKLPHWRLTDPIHPVLYRLPWSLQRPVYLRFLRTLIKKLRAGDVVYVHNRPETAAALATASRIHGYIVVLHMHNSHLIRANRGQLRALRNVPIVFCSEFLRREIHSRIPHHFERTYVVYNGADEKKFHTIERAAAKVPTVIFTGRLVPYKGVHILLEAMRILQRRGIRARCTVVGAAGFGRGRSTSYTRRLERQKPENTVLVGYRSGNALADLLRKANIFCCPSIWNDPFPLAPLEAMATGLPIVASNVGGLPEALSGGGGLLVPPNDAEALADSLSSLVIDPTYRARLGESARASFLGHFVWTSVRDQYEQVMREILV